MKSKTLGLWFIWVIIAAFISGFIEGYEGYQTGLAALLDLIAYTAIVPALWLSIRAIKSGK